MGVLIPQVVCATESGASGAQVIDGSLRFDDSKNQHLKRAISASNRKTFTLSAWVKHSTTDSNDRLLGNYTDSNNYSSFYFRDTPDFQISFVEKVSNTYYINAHSRRMARDTGWYHIVWAIDTTQATDTDRVKLYVNGVQETLNAQYQNGTIDTNAPTLPSQNYETRILAAYDLKVGARSGTDCWDGLMSQFYLIDGQALGPGYFGFTDPLTGTWRPKKFRAEGTTANDGRTWSDSSNLTNITNGAGAFDGDLTGGNYAHATGAGNSGTINFSNLTSVSTLRLYAREDSRESSGKITVNSTDFDFPTTAAWVDVSSALSGGLSSITLKNGDYLTALFAIEVDGVVLRDGITQNLAFNAPASGLGGVTWSSLVSGPVESSYPLSNCFGGTIGSSYTNGTRPSVGNTLTLNVASLSLNVTNVRLNSFISRGPGGGGAPSTYTVNGSTVSIDNSDGDQTNVVAVNGQLNTIAWSYDNGNGPYVYMRGIEVDLGDGAGYRLLTDGAGAAAGVNGFYLPMDGNSPIGEDKSGNGNDFTPVNFGGSNSLDKATGAKPILNTDGGGNVARPGVFGSEVGAYYAVTVASVGGGNRYHFDGVDRPNPTLTRGATYTFDQSDSSNSNHPLRFSITSNGSHGGGSEYTDGVTTNGTPGSAGAYTKITVPHNSADTLYYYCTNHSNMGSSTSQITDETKADPYAWKNVLALPCLGDVSDVSNRINCTSTEKVVTRSGPTNSSADYNFYNGSLEFDGSNDQLTIPANSDFDFGGGDWTFETWINMDTIGSGQALIEYNGQSSTSSPDGQWFFGTSSGWSWYHSSTIYAPIDESKIPINGWIHLAMVRDGNKITSYLNGVAEGTSSYSRSDAGGNSRGFVIGQQNNSSWLNGHIQDFRIYKGVAKYTGSVIGNQYFIPPSTSPDILPDTPSGVSGGSKLDKVTDGAVSFPGGNDDYLSISPGADFAFGTGDFTVECYIYSNNRGTYDYIIDGRNSGQTTGTWSLGYGYAGGNGRLEFASGGSTLLECPANDNPEAHKWYHVAVARSGTSLKMFIDGKEVTSATNSTDLSTSPTTSYIGTRYSTEHSFNGYISNIRVIKGTALYTTDFTPPTRALTNVTNTKLLCCQSNTLAGSAAVSPNISGTNDGTVWSRNYTSTSGFNASYPPSYAFNGSVSNYAEPVDTGSTMTVTFNPPLVVSGDFDVKISSTGELFTTINGGTSTSKGSGLNQYHTLGSDITVSNFTYTSSTRPVLYSVRINGSTILVDPVTTNGDAAATNFNPFTTDINAVRGQETGYSTLNPLDNTGITKLVDGNLSFRRNTNNGRINSTIAASFGKYYAECQVGNDTLVGVSEVSSQTNTYPGGNAGSYGYFGGGQFYDAGSSASYADSFTIDDYIGCILDLDNGTIAYTKNGVSQGVAKTGLPDGSYRFSSRGGRHDGTETLDRWNFGQKPFKFPPPDGFQPLNAANVRPETVITRPDQFVDVSTWTGDGGSRTFTGFSFKPDFAWVKIRSAGYDHVLWDTVRGAGVSKELVSNDSRVEGGASTNLYGYISEFTSNGFITTAGSSNNYYFNQSSQTYVAWAWKAGGNKNTFNVDDVGYANASDVGMNVGGQNSNAYDQTRTWSNSVAADGGSTFVSNQGPTKMFNGVAGMGVEKTELTTNGSATFTSPVQLSGNLRMFIACGSRGSSATGTFDLKLDGVSVFNNSTFPNNAGAWVDFGTKTWTTLQFGTASGGNWLGISAIEVAGKILIDQGVTPTTNFPSIAATGCSVGTKQGFSIIKYTGTGSNASVSHGLQNIPQFIIVKDRDSNSGWWSVYHHSMGNTHALYLNDAQSKVDSSFWNDTTPTSSVFTIGANANTNSSNDFISYLWHDVPGLQKFGSYIGNGNADGPFIELGFRPTLIILKGATVNGEPWMIQDSKRDPFNPSDSALFTSAASQESSGSVRNIDFVSNGFKIRTSDSGHNSNGNTYIYAAWAESPTVNLFGAQSNAR